MTASGDTNPWITLLKQMKHFVIRDIMTGLPGKVVSYDPDTQRAVVECGIQRYDGENGYQTIEPVRHVPVQFAGSGEWTAFHELPAGTEGYIHFSQRAVDYWLENGGPVSPPDARMLDVSDAFFAPGYRSRATCIAGLPQTGIGMCNRAGTVKFHLSESGVSMTVSGNTLVLNASGLFHNGVNIGDSHKHGGVKSGGEHTGGPE